MKRLLSWSAWLSLVWLGAMCVPMLAPSSVSADEIEPPFSFLGATRDVRVAAEERVRDGKRDRVTRHSTCPEAGHGFR